MGNKVIIGILVLLVILMGGIGYYSYMLNQRVDYLSEQLTAFERAQTARVDAVSSELTEFRVETLSSVIALENRLEDKISKNMAEIDALEEEIGEKSTQMASLEEEINGITAQVDILEERIAGAVAEFSHSVLDANEVYQKVSQATVRISDGQNTIGSGFILDTEAHVVTAEHVVENLSQIYVILPDGRISKATSIGSCRFSDVAVLKLKNRPDIDPPPLADSSQVRIGEPVVAIGSPFDLRDTLTAGIISQVNRLSEIQYDTKSRSVTNLLQFDAAANFGNSGCPLANSDGEVIGIVIARVSPDEGDGINWAVAANKVRRVAEAIITQGSFDYPWIGVGIADLTPKIVQDQALETANGVRVVEVYDNEPAEAAGIKVDDIIVSIDDVPVRDSADLTSYLGEFKSPGDMATVGITRGTTKLELSVEVGKRLQ